MLAARKIVLRRAREIANRGVFRLVANPAAPAPKPTVRAFKLFRLRGGQLFPLFIDKANPVPMGAWVDAQHVPTKGFAQRPGWHAGVLPTAPHLRTKAGAIAADRVWAEVEMPAGVNWQAAADATPTGDIRDRVPVGGFYRFRTNKMQGGAWLIGGSLRVVRILDDAEVRHILTMAGDTEGAQAETTRG